MKGIEKRVATGFVCLLALLFASGVISLFELETMSDDTEMILEVSRGNMETARDLLRLSDEHSMVVMHAAIFGEKDYRDDCDTVAARLSRRIELAAENSGRISVDSVVVKFRRLTAVTDEFFASADADDADEEQRRNRQAFKSDAERINGEIWYGTIYEPAYKDLVEEVTNYMTKTYTSLTPRAAQLQKNAYRSVAPIFIALLVMIAITLIFYYMIHIYCLKPIVRISERLASFLNFGMTYDVKCEKIDEIGTLDEEIANLISRTPSAAAKETKQN